MGVRRCSPPRLRWRWFRAGPTRRPTGTRGGEGARDADHPRRSRWSRNRRQKRPNVLVIEADDMRWDDIRYMPNVQRLLGQAGGCASLVLAVPAVLPGPGELPARPVRAQPPCAQHEVPTASRVPTTGARSRPRCTGPATTRRWSASTSTSTASSPRGTGGRPCSTCLRAGPHWLSGLDHDWPAGLPFHGNTYDYFALTQNVNGPTGAFPGRYSTTWCRRRRRADHPVRRGPGSRGSSGGPRWRRTTARRWSPTTPRRSLSTDGGVQDW